MSELKLGLPKGSLEAATIELFRKSGWKIVGMNRSYFPSIDDDSLILWANAYEPYLVELRFPSHDLRFARAIGVTQFGSQIHARTDSIQVRGFRYPIGRIYKLSRDEARRLSQS